MNRRGFLAAGFAALFVLAGCGRSGPAAPPEEPAPPARPRPAGPHAVIRWQGNADLDFEIWDASGQEYLRDAAGETAAADAPGGNDREEVLDLAGVGDTMVVIAVGCWDFKTSAEAPAELEVAADLAPRLFRATLTPERNLWKAFRWDPVRGRIEAIDEVGHRDFDALAN